MKASRFACEQCDTENDEQYASGELRALPQSSADSVADEQPKQCETESLHGDERERRSQGDVEHTE